MQSRKGRYDSVGIQKLPTKCVWLECLELEGTRIFSVFEKKLLEGAGKHFSSGNMLKRLNTFLDRGWGFENWFQNELLIAWPTAVIRGKMELDADILIDEKTGIELKCWLRKYPTKRNLINAFSQHPAAHLYLFLVEKDDRMLEKLDKYLESNCYISKSKQLNRTFRLIIIKKKTQDA